MIRVCHFPPILNTLLISKSILSGYLWYEDHFGRTRGGVQNFVYVDGGTSDTIECAQNVNEDPH